MPISGTQTLGDLCQVHVVNSTGEVLTSKDLYFHDVFSGYVYGGVDYDKMNDQINKLIEVNDIGYPCVAEIASRSAVTKFGYLPGTREEAKNIQQLCSSNRIKYHFFQRRERNRSIF
jgi:hypothetical protein